MLEYESVARKSVPSTGSEDVTSGILWDNSNGIQTSRYGYIAGT